MSYLYSLGIDIGGTKCAAVLGRGELGDTTDGFIIDRSAFKTDVKRGYKAVIDELFSTAENLLLKNGVKKTELIGIGISCGGPLDSKKGTINCPPNLPDWDNVPITALFEERFGVKAVLHNDANACAVAEWRFGAGKNTENMVFLTFGTGMGAGLILNGRLYTGASDMAGEVGHIRLSEGGPEGYGKKGSFEGFCSGGGIADLAKIIGREYLNENKKSMLFESEKDISLITAAKIAEAMYGGDEFSKEVFKTSAEYLGRGLSVIIDILNPEMIVIGSIYERNSEFFNSVIVDIIKKEALINSASVCKIVPAKLGDSIGDFAALGILF